MENSTRFHARGNKYTIDLLFGRFEMYLDAYSFVIILLNATDVSTTMIFTLT